MRTRTWSLQTSTVRVARDHHRMFESVTHLISFTSSRSTRCQARRGVMQRLYELGVAVADDEEGKFSRRRRRRRLAGYHRPSTSLSIFAAFHHGLQSSIRTPCHFSSLSKSSLDFRLAKNRTTSFDSPSSPELEGHRHGQAEEWIKRSTFDFITANMLPTSAEEFIVSRFRAATVPEGSVIQ